MLDSPVLLSIVIVAYKSRDEIGACVGSLPQTLVLADGTAGRVEVVVVDNSPTEWDGVGDVLRREFPWVEYLAPVENLGFGRANNAGFARTKGEYVLFLNPDTVSNARALTRGVERVRADKTIGMISPQLVQADGSMDLACRRSIPTLWDGFCRASGLATRWPGAKLFAGYNLTHLPVGGSYDVGAINGAFMLGRREVLAQVAEPAGSAAVFDENFFMYGDDLDLCIRVRRAGWRIVYDGSVQITHLKGLSVGKDYDAMSQAIFDANRAVYLKHFARSPLARFKYAVAFSAWKKLALLRARQRGHRQVRPV